MLIDVDLPFFLTAPRPIVKLWSLNKIIPNWCQWLLLPKGAVRRLRFSSLVNTKILIQLYCVHAAGLSKRWSWSCVCITCSSKWIYNLFQKARPRHKYSNYEIKKDPDMYSVLWRETLWYWSAGCFFFFFFFLNGGLMQIGKPTKASNQIWVAGKSWRTDALRLNTQLRGKIPHKECSAVSPCQATISQASSTLCFFFLFFFLNT